jgi:hypothetical protein
MTTDFRAELERLVKAYDDHGGRWPDDDVRALYQAVQKARAALSAPEQGATDEELISAYQSAYEPAWKRGEYSGCHVDGLRAVLARWGRPAVEPVPVDERLPGPEDCAPWPGEPDANPWAWAAKCVDGGWEWIQLSILGLDSDTLGRMIAGGGWTHWAPHWALPVPQEGAMADLSPAAQAIMIAATNGNHNCQVDPVYRQCIAAALRVVADEVVPHEEVRLLLRGHELERLCQRRHIRAQLLAIAAELKGQR